MSDEVKIHESIDDDTLEGVAGGSSNIDFIICPGCGLEIKLKGWQHNFQNKCPRCGKPVHSW